MAAKDYTTTCELCYAQHTGDRIPDDWDIVWQSPICPDCQEKCKIENTVREIQGLDPIHLPDRRGGCFANGKPDPRA
jgi:hypothetical protein